MSPCNPPIALVKTWLQLVSFSTEKEVSNHSKRMINRNFGSVDLAIIYIEQNQPTQNEDAELKRRGKNMLLGSFKDKQTVAHCIKKHHIEA
jgi:hypothetical protein